MVRLGFGFVAILFVAILMGVAAATRVPKDTAKEVYFPTTKGAKWVYRDDGYDTVEVVTDVKTEGNITLVTVGYESRDRVNPFMQISVSEAGLAVLAGTGVDAPLKEPLWLLKLPHTDGHKWETVISANQGRWTGTSTATGRDEVKVPAGTFQAIKVKYDGQGITEARVERTDWYAPRVGKVKSLVNGKESVLKSFMPGKP